jgi:hypothetical protein
MNEQKVQEMLQKYFDGATSIEEERDLQRYFAIGDLPESLKAYRPMFTFFEEERAVMPPKHETRRIRLTLSVITGIAASIAILFMVGLPRLKSGNDYVYYVNGQRIYDQTAALELAGNKLQSLAVSMQKAQNSMTTFDKVQESAQQLQQFSKISEAYRKVELGIRN